MVEMDLSIVIVSYNGKEFLEKCLESTTLASKNIKSEILVVDNNSKDGSPDLVKKKFKDVKLIVNKTNVGFSKANNQGLKVAKGKYILILNPDTELSSDSLIKMLRFMDSNPNIALSTCRLQLENGNLDRDCRRHFPTPWRAFCHFTNLEKFLQKSKIFDQYYYGYQSAKVEHEIDACSGAFMFVRKKILQKVDFFDEEFFFYGEDLDLCYRIKESGASIVYTPITSVTHHKGVSSGIKKTTAHLSAASIESKKRALYESARAMKLFYQKHYKTKYPAILNWIIIIAISLTEKIRVLKLGTI